MNWKLNFANLLTDPIPVMHALRPKVNRVLSRFSSETGLCLWCTLNGNRTWASEEWLDQRSDPIIWHRKWSEAVERTLIDVRTNMSHIYKYAFMWGLSVWNLDQKKWRSREEVNWLLQLAIDFAQRRWLELAHQYRMHIFLIWDETLLNERDPRVTQAMNKLSDQTSCYDDEFRLAIWLAYSLENEINRHVDILRDNGRVWKEEELRHEAFLFSHKWIPFPDVAIRTGTDGKRTSGGFIWPNSEMIFCVLIGHFLVRCFSGTLPIVV